MTCDDAAVSAADSSHPYGQNLIQVPTQASFQKRMRYTEEAVLPSRADIFSDVFAHLY
jgi:hypothetical protein